MYRNNLNTLLVIPKAAHFLPSLTNSVPHLQGELEQQVYQ